MGLKRVGFKLEEGGGGERVMAIKGGKLVVICREVDGSDGWSGKNARGAGNIKCVLQFEEWIGRCRVACVLAVVEGASVWRVSVAVPAGVREGLAVM